VTLQDSRPHLKFHPLKTGRATSSETIHGGTGRHGSSNHSWPVLDLFKRDLASAGGHAIAAAADVADSAAVEAMVARTDAACQIVEPPISPNGWCRYFYPQPVVRYRRRAAAGPAY